MRRALVQLNDRRAHEDAQFKEERRAKVREYLAKGNREQVARRGEHLFKVVHERVAVRSEPSRAAKILGLVQKGDEVIASRAEDHVFQRGTFAPNHGGGPRGLSGTTWLCRRRQRSRGCLET